MVLLRLVVLVVAASVSMGKSAYIYDETTAMRSLIFSAAAYGRFEDINAWNFTEPACRPKGFAVEAASFDAKESSQGYIGVDYEHKQIVLAFRGTNDFANEMEDLSNPLRYRHDCVVDGMSLGNVHTGFCGYYQSLNASAIAKRAHDMQQAHPTYQLLVTGHSLGGAVAAVAATHIAQVYPGTNPLLYTFGEPRAGDVSFVQKFEASGCQGFRVAHREDPVVRVPFCCHGCKPSSTCPLHQAAKVFYPDDMNPEGGSKHIVCSPGEDAQCDSPIGTSSASDHLNYFEKHVGYLCYRA